MNHFAPQDTAERYAIGRPRFHHHTIEHIRKVLKIETKLEKALDIACGTGLSTRALREISQSVYGTDTSDSMLANALDKDRIHYSIAPAEDQPFQDNSFDLVTVCSGVHWFDIDRFLLEAKRILKPKGSLVLYDNFFISEMEGEASFKKWFPEVYLKQFPSPKRNSSYQWNQENLGPKDLVLWHEDQFSNSIEYTKSELILYFTTQSNISAAVKSGQYTFPDVEAWLSEVLSVYFPDDSAKQTIHFGNWIRYIRKKGSFE